MTAPAGPTHQYLMDNTGVLHPGGSPSTAPSLAQGAEGQESSQNEEPHGKWKTQVLKVQGRQGGALLWSSGSPDSETVGICINQTEMA